MHGTRSLLRTTPLLIAALVVGSCSYLRAGASAWVNPLEEQDVERLAVFHCVTAETATVIKAAVPREDDAYARAALLYQEARDAFNPVVEHIAKDVEDGDTPDMEVYRVRLAEAEVERAKLATFAEAEAAGFGFVGLETLIAAATPYARRLALRFLEDKARQLAADHMREQFMLPPFADVATECATGGRP